MDLFMQTPSSISTLDIDPNLKLVDFDQETPEQLKAQITEAIDSGNQFLDKLDNQFEEQPDAVAQPQPALTDIIEFDHIGLNLDRSWGILSHLNSVMSNEDIREVHHEMLPLLSAFSTRVGQNKPLYTR